jgi:hypothetical protein
MPYTVFLDFISSIKFDFMDLVKQEFENRGNKIDNDDNESAIAAILAKAVEREAEVTKLREAAEEEYLNTLLEARIAHSSQGISPCCYSVLHTPTVNNNNNQQPEAISGTQLNVGFENKAEEENDGVDDDADEFVVPKREVENAIHRPIPLNPQKRNTRLPISSFKRHHILPNCI